MERSKNTDLNIPENSHSSVGSTYASVLSNGRSSDDFSNNNPSIYNSTPNENLSSTDNCKEIHQGTTSDKHNVSNSNSSELSQSDSFEDAEESHLVDDVSSVKDETHSKVISADDSAASAATITSADSQTNSQPSNDLQSSGEYSDSEEDSGSSEEGEEIGELGAYASAIKWQFRSNNTKFDLPDTVAVLTTNQGSKVFVVGTAHFSAESQEDVAKTIQAVQPDVVMIELCKSRVNILSLDEETIIEESKNMNFMKIKAAIDQNGLLQGLLYLLLLSISAHLTKQLGMAPGGEFRRAFAEAKQIPGCLVHLGDRPIHITLQRALAKLSWWQKLRIAWYMLRNKDPISKEDVERCKQKDLLEEMLAEMTGQFPELSQVFLNERDVYLTYSLQMSAAPVPSPHSPNVYAPAYVVGVVGIGHVAGIKENWGKVTENDILPILSVPEKTLTSKIIRKTLRYSLLGLGVYGVYKILPKSLTTGLFQNSYFKSMPFFR